MVLLLIILGDALINSREIPNSGGADINVMPRDTWRAHNNRFTTA